MKRSICSLWLILATAVAVAGSIAPTVVGHVKVMIHKRSENPRGPVPTTIPIPRALLGQFGAVPIDEQQGYVLVDVARSALGGLTAALANHALAVEERDDLDIVSFLNFPVDSRLPIPTYPAGYQRTASLGPDVRDEYLIQFQSLPRPEWLDALRKADIVLVDYVPQNAYKVLGSMNALTSALASSPVQLIRLYQPIHKIAAVLRQATADFTDVNIVVHKSPEGNLARQYLQSISLPEVRSNYEAADRSTLRATVSTASLPRLASFAGVLWIEPATVGALSGEREVSIAAGLGTWAYPQTLKPGTPGAYQGFLSASGVNPESLAPIGMLDAGWHNGAGSVQNDLRSSSGGNTVTVVNYCDTDHLPDTDCPGHGTMITGVIGGNAAAAYGSHTQDGSGGYYMGLGIAPGNAVINGRIFSLNGSSFRYYQPAGWPTIYSDLSSRGARVTNNSWNDVYTSYTTDSAAIDALVRHSGAIDSFPGMTIVFSAGNQDAAPTNDPGVTAPATAKNVITVGATQGYNPNPYPDMLAGSAGGPTGGDAASNANTVWSGSRIGPTADGRIKPDLVASGTGVEAPRTEYAGTACTYNPYPVVGSTIDPAGPVNSRHIWSRGTSFAAPLVAGAANLLSAWQGQISPALRKAMLIGLSSPLATNDFRPTNASGWGRVDLTDAFHHTYPTGYYMVDQSIVMTAGSAFYQTPDLTPLDPNKPVKIVLTWTDAPGTPGYGPQLKNDLDLVVYSRQYFGLFCGGNNFDAPGYGTMGWSTTFGYGRFPTYDRKNNVEVVLVPSDLGSTFWVEVRNTSIIANAINVAGGYPAQQDFALFIQNVH